MTRWHKIADLKRLDKALMALAETNENIMFLPELDGFCTGLILCPEMIPPSVWLKEVWGGDGEPEFESLEAFQKVLGLIMGHYNRVAEMLTRPDVYWPVMNEDEATGTVLFADWVEGFIRAVRISPTGWQQLVESGDQEALAAFSLLLEIPLLGTGKGDLDEDQEARLLEGAADLIPNLVLELNRFTKSLPMAGAAAPFPFAANMPGQPTRAGRPGRNDPCHCGSGKKYKKCCGAH